MVTGQKRTFFRSNISRAKYRQLVRLFAMDLEATKAAQLAHVSRRTVNRYFHLFRVRMAAACEVAQGLSGTIEVDESYVGPRRVRGKVGAAARHPARFLLLHLKECEYRFNHRRENLYRLLLKLLKT